MARPRTPGKKASSRKKTPRKVTPATVRRLALALPGVSEAPSYGTPGFRVSRKLFARLHQDGKSLVARIEPAFRAPMIQALPDVFFVTDHYENHPWVLVRLSRVTTADLRDILENSWRLVASRKLRAEFDDGD